MTPNEVFELFKTILGGKEFVRPESYTDLITPKYNEHLHYHALAL